MITLIPETGAGTAGAGTAGANTYATEAQADLWWSAAVSAQATAWSAATQDRKRRALAQATRYLDTACTWIGNQASIDQPLAWPRTGMTWKGFQPNTGWIPQPVINATCELAGLLLSKDLQADQESDNLASISLGNGAVEISFKDGSQTRRMPTAIGELLNGTGWPVGSGGKGLNVRPTTR